METATYQIIGKASPKYLKKLECRIFDNVEQTDTGCWEWTKSRDGKGYGHIYVNGRDALTHRVAFELRVGPIPAGYCVCHHCDNPSCLNPNHLFTGTVKDNTHDMIRKGRNRVMRGAENGCAKVNPKIVRTIRLRRSFGHTTIQLAKEYGLTTGQISNIATGKSWAHIR